MSDYRQMIIELLDSGKSLREIARKSGVSYGTVNNLYNRDDCNPTQRTVDAITALYNSSSAK